MFILRSVRREDLADLFELSQLQVFINLPADKKILTEKIEASLQSFSKPDSKLENNYYIFVLEDIQGKKVIGVSMIHGKHGTEEEPHFYLKVAREQKYSKTLNTGFIHGTLQLGIETDGWSEIGGLILDPEYRNSKEKLGKQLSYVRFLYMGLYPDKFTTYIHCELMPPFDSLGRSPLWEAIGRRFMNMEYHDADLLSRQNKEFILSLFPSNIIYETLLPPEARNAIGKVGHQTLPVKKMLESAGFYYTEEVDPFDGGPHYRALLADIKPIRESVEGRVKSVAEFDSQDNIQRAIITLPSEQHQFFAVSLPVVVKSNSDHDHTILVRKSDLTALNQEDNFNSTVVFL